MNVFESVRFALRGISANKLRSGLTVLGVVIGIAAVTAMVSVGQGAGELIQGEFRSLGTNVILIFPGRVQQSGVREGMRLATGPQDSKADAFYQKRFPKGAPDWVRTVTVERRKGGEVTHAVGGEPRQQRRIGLPAGDEAGRGPEQRGHARVLFAAGGAAQ